MFTLMSTVLSQLLFRFIAVFFVDKDIQFRTPKHQYKTSIQCSCCNTIVCITNADAMAKLSVRFTSYIKNHLARISPVSEPVSPGGDFSTTHNHSRRCYWHANARASELTRSGRTVKVPAMISSWHAVGLLTKSPWSDFISLTI